MNVPNTLSVLRGLLVVPLMVALRDGRTEAACVLLCAALVTDLLDGALARRLRQTTELGRILDPIADKVLVAGALVALALSDRVPRALVAVVILRDAALVGTAWVRCRGGAPVPSSTPVGKVAFGILGAYLGGVVFGIDWSAWVAPLVAAVYVVAGVSYATRLPRVFFGRVLKEER